MTLILKSLPIATVSQTNSPQPLQTANRLSADIHLYLAIMIGLIVVFIALVATVGIIGYLRNRRQQQVISILLSTAQSFQDQYLKQHKFVPLGEVQQALTKKSGRCRTLYKYDFSGCYIFWDRTLDKYYVGQSIHVIHRLVQHLSQRGSKEVFQALQDGNEFYYTALPLAGSPFSSLNQMERMLIERYHSVTNGYNETAGNGNDPVTQDQDIDQVVSVGARRHKTLSSKEIIAVVAAYKHTYPDDKNFVKLLKAALKN